MCFFMPSYVSILCIDLTVRIEPLFEHVTRICRGVTNKIKSHSNENLSDVLVDKGSRYEVDAIIPLRMCFWARSSMTLVDLLSYTTLTPRSLILPISLYFQSYSKFVNLLFI